MDEKIKLSLTMGFENTNIMPFATRERPRSGLSSF